MAHITHTPLPNGFCRYHNASTAELWVPNSGDNELLPLWYGRTHAQQATARRLDCVQSVKYLPNPNLLAHSRRNYTACVTPPSNPDAMTNLTCSITSLSDLLDKADRNLLNLTTTVASCPGICSLAWGKGNPDLSGIGVMISYIMQGVLTFLCGPVIGFLYHLDSVSNEPTRRRLSEVTHLFLEISAGFNIPVAIAAAFRMAQSPPYFDQFSMLYVLGAQGISFISVMLTSMSFEKSHLSPNLPTTLFYLNLQGFLFFVVMTAQSSSDYKWASTRQLFEDCRSYSQITLFRVPSAEEVILPYLAEKSN